MSGKKKTGSYDMVTSSSSNYYEKLIKDPKHQTSKLVLARLEPSGYTTISGLSISYCTKYPLSLRGYVSEKDFAVAIGTINNTLQDYFPCPPCYLCGYLTCLATLGISSLADDPCTKEANSNANQVIKRVNMSDTSLENGIKWKLVREKRKSWIEISQINYNY